MTEHKRVNRTLAGVLLPAVAIACSSPTAPPEEQEPGPAGDGFSIAFEASTHTLVPGEVLAIVLKIERAGGFEGVIDLEASDAPGFVVIFRPATVIHRDDSDLLLVADQSTPRRTHQIQFTATSEGHPVKTAMLAVTVVDTK